ncbi:MAG: hypothetical protein KTR25_11685 [Myxococcales bacterium]|nr:hypothetical protein [Myxococcales bacterium]
MSLPSGCGDDAVARGCDGSAPEGGRKATDPAQTLENKSERGPEVKDTP